jgi:phenylacetate-coenzyme A ligase PaaK-like adenylate-forming protein
VSAEAATRAQTISVVLAAELESRLPGHGARLGWDAQRLARHQRERLRELLAVAIERSPFHAGRLGGVDPARFELDDLERLPVMTKAEMMGAYDEVVTDRRLTRATVEEHLAGSIDEPDLLFDEYVCLASGGSSGVRGIFAHRVGEYADFGASVMRNGWARMAAMGGPPPGGVVVAMVGASSSIHSTGLAAAVVRDGPFRFHAAPATAPLERTVEVLNELSPVLLMGYPGRLAQLARERAAGRLEVAPVSITSTSEPLGAEQRAAIEAGFGVPVVDQFASTEGLAGQTEPGGTVHTFADDMCIAELVDADNRPVAPGETSAKVLVTNLHNFTQPIIRYELTDRFTAEPAVRDGAFLRARVEGRADEVFRYGLVEVQPHALRSPLVAAAVREHRVRQTAAGVEVEVVGDEVDAAALAQALESSLVTAGVEDARATVRVVERIERDPVTAKTRRFVPLPRA